MPFYFLIKNFIFLRIIFFEAQDKFSLVFMSLHQSLHDQLQTNFTAGAGHIDENRLILKHMEIWKSKKKNTSWPTTKAQT